MSAEQNKTIAHRFWEAQDRQDACALDRLLSADFLNHMPGSPGPVDREGFMQVYGMFYAAFPDLRHTIEDLIAEGDKVAVRLSVRGTHRGAFQGMPPSGRPFAVTATSVLRIAGGQIAEQWVDFDQLGLLQQLGAIPT